MSADAPAIPPPRLNILVVDDEPNIRKVLAASLSMDGARVLLASSADEAMAIVAREPVDLAFVDLRLGTERGLDLIPKLLGENASLSIVVITAFASVETAVEAMRRGAADYLPKPFTPDQVRLAVERASYLRGLERKVADLQSALGDAGEPIDLNSGSAAMQRAFGLAKQVADSDATVLIRGESGTGKGVLARAIHQWSSRRDEPMSTVSCPAISPQLLESELFGHVRGAFTGAVRDYPGRIASSQGGTLFLDEIGDLPLNLQPKLLRFVQERVYERVGDTVTRHADVRLVTATNIDLDAAARAGTFRQDLLYRINVVQIDLPPLRDRVEDLLPLARAMLAHFSRRKPLTGFTPEAEAALAAYHWPGNVRELRNAIERAAILARGELVGVENLPATMATRSSGPRLGDGVPFEVIEAEHIRRLLATTPTIEQAAKALNIDTATLWRKRKKYGI